MAEYTNSAGVPSLNAALMHTLQRHRDILQVIHWAWDLYVIIGGLWVFFTPWREHMHMYLGEQREKSSKRVNVLWKFVLFCFFVFLVIIRFWKCSLALSFAWWNWIIFISRWVCYCCGRSCYPAEVAKRPVLIHKQLWWFLSSGFDDSREEKLFAIFSVLFEKNIKSIPVKQMNS